MRIYNKVTEPSDARVIVPFTKKNRTLQTVVDALRYQFVQPELVKVRGGTEYWELLDREWRKGETFHIVEHDVIVWPGAIWLMDRCPQQWCTLPIICRGRYLGTPLGCSKFSGELTRKCPEIWERIDKSWSELDARLTVELKARYDMAPHVHHPGAVHLNEVHWPDNMSTRYESWKVWKLDGANPVTVMGGEEDG